MFMDIWKVPTKKLEITKCIQSMMKFMYYNYIIDDTHCTWEIWSIPLLILIINLLLIRAKYLNKMIRKIYKIWNDKQKAGGMNRAHHF